MSDLYNRIESLCQNKNISITTMCKESGVSRASLSDLKVGRKQGLSSETLSKIAAFLNVSVDFLLTGYPANIYFCPDDENPHEIEMLETFDTLDVDAQIYANIWLRAFAADPDRIKKSPDQLSLTEGEEMLLNLFRQVPADQQELVLQMIRAALGTQK